MLPHLVQRRAAVAAGRTHFVEAVDEQRLAGELAGLGSRVAKVRARR